MDPLTTDYGFNTWTDMWAQTLPVYWPSASNPARNARAPRSYQFVKIVGSVRIALSIAAIEMRSFVRRAWTIEETGAAITSIDTWSWWPRPEPQISYGRFHSRRANQKAPCPTVHSCWPAPWRAGDPFDAQYGGPAALSPQQRQQYHCSWDFSVLSLA